MPQRRGMLTERVQAKSKEMIGREIDLTELRLIPYVHFVMTNHQYVEPKKINPDERKVLRVWKDAGYCEGGVGGLVITKEFYDFMSEILWLAYVDIEHD